ncbi:MAG: hypothetical protein JWQ44_2858 [Chthoniobacter sp.]|jgi:hypothetical protein|nr:hypothetical protein [Chthoniobacter sp.]
MTRIPDPLLKKTASERLHYATGELLGADDFRDEQTYHRRQLAQALLFLNGSGTLAGLRVIARHRPGQNGAPDEVHLEVQPGLALDRAGRLIEVPREACLRLRRWFEFIAERPPENAVLDAGDLLAAFRDGVVVADVFLAFHACDRGYTPAFASGPFDALDASQPSRVRDAYELSLVLRSETTPPISADPWTAVTDLASAQQASLGAWDALDLPPAGHVGDWRENPAGIDPTAVLLARVRIPATPGPTAASAPVPDWTAAIWADTAPGENPNIDNRVRNFILPPAAIRRMAGA